MDAKTRANRILKLLLKNYPGERTALKYSGPFQLLVSVILSAQCTDKRVNIVTKTLFKKYKTAKDFAKADIKKLEQEIRSTGFYRNKARNIRAAAQIVVKDFSGKTPDTMEELLTLPGVARKTANVVLSAAFKKNEGIAIDTHCIRLTQRWKLTKNRDPVKIEQDVMKLIPRKNWGTFSFKTIKHGREFCYARKPNCKGCFLNKICPSAFKQ
ncbi:endonuclease III [Candidatus Woesearchaeota archaeon]|nr:endonuclease III [Candidatus Woesearchaeota archaeon]